MANRMFKPLKGSLTQGITCLTGSWTFGSSGAVTFSGVGFGVSTSSSGVQTITLEDKYNALLGVQFTVVDSGFTAAGSSVVEVTSEDVDGAKTIVLKYIAADEGDAQTEANLDGKKVLCMIWLKNSSV